MTTPTEVLSATAAPGDAARAGTGILALFGATLFLSAFLLFLLEPMIAKMVLPVLGGTPMVWNTWTVRLDTALPTWGMRTRK